MPITPTPDPMELFAQWYEEVQECGLKEPAAVHLATADSAGRPSCRVVLLKQADAQGFVVFTNRESRKGQELLANPHAALCFHWMPLSRQVRVEGRVEMMSDVESDAYFASRKRGSQIGAWASLQSQPMRDVEELKQRVSDIERQYEGQDVPRPPHWGGVRIVPEYLEFWQEQLYRLHDRLAYSRVRDVDSWRTEVLYP